MRTLADDRTIVIKKADKGSCVVVWDHNNFVKEAEKQLNDIKDVYKDVCFNEKHLEELVVSEILKLKEKLVISNLNVLRINIKKLLTLANCIFYLRYINVWQMFLEGL